MLLLSYIVKKAMQKSLMDRQDDSKFIEYPDIKDYPDLTSEDFTFKEGKETLVGSKYYLKNKTDFKAIVIFFHGMLGGRKAYLKQIFSIAEQGYLVYAYDNLTCGDSSGHKWYNLYSSVKDMGTFFKFFEKENKLNLPIYSCGHSWGGFTSLSTIYKDYPTEKIVVLSGFADPYKASVDLNPGIKKLVPLIKMSTYRYYFKFAKRNLKKLLNETNKEVLFIHGEEDDIVFYNNFTELKEKFENKKNIKFISVPKMHHQVFMTERGEKYLNEQVNQGVSFGKIPFDKAKKDLFWEQNDAIMNEIYKFYEDK